MNIEAYVSLLALFLKHELTNSLQSFPAAQSIHQTPLLVQNHNRAFADILITRNLVFNVNFPRKQGISVSQTIITIL